MSAQDVEKLVGSKRAQR